MKPVSTTILDWQLLAEYASNNSHEAFAMIVARYADMVHATALRRSRNPALAEDATQAVFIVLARSASKLKPTGSLAAWLHRTALHAAANAIRAEIRRERRERRCARPEGISPDRVVAHTADVTALIEQEMHRLSEADRDVIAMHYLEELSVADIARRCDISSDAVRKRLERAMQRLRGRLARHRSALDCAALGAILGGLSRSQSRAVARQIPGTAVAGGKNGVAFRLADGIIRYTRLIALGKAAIAAVFALLLFTAAGIGLAQRRSPASTAPTPAPAIASTLPSLKLELPAVIRLALERNAAQLNPVTVNWSEQSSSPLTPEQAARDLHLDFRMADEFINIRRRMMVTHQDAKYLVVREDLPRESKFNSDAKVGLVEESTFDGIRRLGGSRLGNDGPWRMLITPIDHYSAAEQDNVYFNAWYFDLVGLPLSLRVADLKEARPPQSKVVQLLEQGVELFEIADANLEGHMTVRLRLVGPNPERRNAEATDLDKVAEEFRDSPN